MDLSKYQIKKTKITSERQLLLKEFLDYLNVDVKPPYKPMTAPRLGMMLSPMTTSQLKTFLGECKNAKNFRSLFFWKLNPKNYAG